MLLIQKKLLKYRFILKLTNIVEELKKRDCGQAIGKSRGGLTSKIHAVTDGNTHDCTQMEKLIDKVIHKGVYVLADRAYDADKIIKYITFKLAIPTITPRKNRKIQRDYDKQVYKNRNQIERFFNRLKQFRSIATRYDKLTLSFLSFV